MSSAREYKYHFEKVNFLNTVELLQYLAGSYEADKQTAASDPQESSRLLFDVFMKVNRHKDLYTRQHHDKPYEDLIVGATGKLPAQLVEDDFKTTFQDVTHSVVPSLVPHVGIFSTKRLGLEIDSKMEDIDLSSPTKKLLNKDDIPSDSEARAACSCWPL